jgi:hypothetical protein
MNEGFTEAEPLLRSAALRAFSRTSCKINRLGAELKKGTSFANIWSKRITAYRGRFAQPYTAHRRRSEIDLSIPFEVPSPPIRGRPSKHQPLFKNLPPALPAGGAPFFSTVLEIRQDDTPDRQRGCRFGVNRCTAGGGGGGGAVELSRAWALQNKWAGSKDEGEVPTSLAQSYRFRDLRSHPLCKTIQNPLIDRGRSTKSNRRDGASPPRRSQKPGSVFHFGARP